jgi:hypothetical protein
MPFYATFRIASSAILVSFMTLALAIAMAIVIPRASHSGGAGVAIISGSSIVVVLRYVFGLRGAYFLTLYSAISFSFGVFDDLIG